MDVRNNVQDLIARNISRERLFYQTTGGTTGVHLGLYHDKDTTDLREWLDEEWFGIRIIFLDRVSRTPRGKLTLLEQRLPITFKDNGAARCEKAALRR